MATKVDFDVGIDQIIFTTQTNGDRIEIKDINLSSDSAADMARMLNDSQTFNIVIKET